MILGVQWLITLGSIVWNFENLTMEFVYEGRRHLLEGLRNEGIKWDNGRKNLCSHAVHLFAVHIVHVSMKSAAPQLESKEARLESLLQEYGGIFKEPKALPPHRSCDYKIIFKEGTSPINVRPYRYPALQKDIIEQTIKEMLEAGVVRPS